MDLVAGVTVGKLVVGVGDGEMTGGVDEEGCCVCLKVGMVGGDWVAFSVFLTVVWLGWGEFEIRRLMRLRLGGSSERRLAAVGSASGGYLLSQDSSRVLVAGGVVGVMGKGGTP